MCLFGAEAAAGLGRTRKLHYEMAPSARISKENLAVSVINEGSDVMVACLPFGKTWYFSLVTFSIISLLCAFYLLTVYVVESFSTYIYIQDSK